MLSPSDRLDCVFGDDGNAVVNQAAMSPDIRGQLTCALPMPGQLPSTPEQQGGPTFPSQSPARPPGGACVQVLTSCLCVCVSVRLQTLCLFR